MRFKDRIGKEFVVGSPTCFRGLGVAPVISENGDGFPTVELLDEAIRRGTVRILETSDAGEVPFLLLINSGEHPILVLEGEELVGGKQNRVVNSSILVLAGTELKIPVSCMEAGRWFRRKEEFDAGDALFRAKSRAVHKAGVTSNIRGRGNFQSDQGAVWDQVSLSLHQLGVESATSDFRAGREKVAQRIEVFVDGLHPRESQVGALFFTSRGILGCEILGSEDLFRRSFAKIVRSFAFEALDEPDLEDVPSEMIGEWWENVLEAEVTVHRSPGVGEDLRLTSRNSIGSGLLWEGRLVHFSCFPIEVSDERPLRRSTRRAGVSERRNRMKRKVGH